MIDSPNFVKVQNSPGLVKDKRTGAVLNVDVDKYRQHKQLQAIAKKNLSEKSQMSSQINSLNSEINNIKDDINEIKNLLQILIKEK